MATYTQDILDAALESMTRVSRTDLSIVCHAIAAERERCAKLCETTGMASGGPVDAIRYAGYVLSDPSGTMSCGGKHEGMAYAALIRRQGD